MRCILFFYNLIGLLLIPLIFPYYLIRKFLKAKPIVSFRDRFALVNIPQHTKSDSIWLHAVSVGEVLTLVPFVKEIKKKYPNKNIFVSSTTPTGHYTAEKHLPSDVHVFYCPFDFFFSVKRIFRKINPSRLIIAETELWPNLIYYGKKHCSTISIINGRISDRSLPKYRKFKYLFSPFIEIIDHILVQSAQDKKRFISIGAQKEKVIVTGNMKFDTTSQIISNLELGHLILNTFGEKPLEILLCGSTMSGEESILAPVFRKLLEKRPTIRFIVAPRHPERFTEVVNIFSSHGLRVKRRSEIKNDVPTSQLPNIIVIDTMGELSSLFFIADVVFIGGTLVPTGGHNVLEPAAQKKAIIVGPSTYNFKEISDTFLARRAMLQVDSPKQFETTVGMLLENDGLRREFGENAYKIIDENRGATLKNIDIIFKDTR